MPRARGSSWSSCLQLPTPDEAASLSLVPGAEAVIDEAATAAAKARHVALAADARGALCMIRRLEAVPTLLEYRALRSALNTAEV